MPDPGLALSAGRRIVPAIVDCAGTQQLVSHASAPTVLRPWLADRRRLGVAVRRIVLEGLSGPTHWLARQTPDPGRPGLGTLDRLRRGREASSN